MTSSQVSTHADVIANGGEIGVAWSGNGIHVTRLDTTGGALRELTFDSSGVTPSLDWDGSRYCGRLREGRRHLLRSRLSVTRYF